jgi:hypothetical protein
MGDLIHLTGNPSNRRSEHVLNDPEKRAYFVSSCMGNLYGRLGMDIVSSDVHTEQEKGSGYVGQANNDNIFAHETIEIDKHLHDDIWNTINEYIEAKLNNKPEASQSIHDLTGLINQLPERMKGTKDISPTIIQTYLNSALKDASLAHFRTNIFASPDRGL